MQALSYTPVFNAYKPTLRFQATYKILHVEDDKLFREAFAELFEIKSQNLPPNDTFTLLQAITLDEGLGKLHNNDVDVVITDGDLGEGEHNGGQKMIDAVRNLNEKAANDKKPVAVAVFSGDPEEKFTNYDAYFQKSPGSINKVFDWLFQKSWLKPAQHK